jgi:hypothetical protein
MTRVVATVPRPCSRRSLPGAPRPRPLSTEGMNGSGRRMTTQTDYEVLEAQQQLYPAQITLAQIRQDRLL